MSEVGEALPGSAGELTEDAIVRYRGERPEHGWRGALYRLTGGLVNPGLPATHDAFLALTALLADGFGGRPVSRTPMA